MGDEDGLRVRTRYRATHWVSFVLYNPTNFTDPSGHDGIPHPKSWECGPDGTFCENGYVRTMPHQMPAWDVIDVMFGLNFTGEGWTEENKNAERAAAWREGVGLEGKNGITPWEAWRKAFKLEPGELFVLEWNPNCYGCRWDYCYNNLDNKEYWGANETITYIDPKTGETVTKTGCDCRPSGSVTVSHSHVIFASMWKNWNDKIYQAHHEFGHAINLANGREPESDLPAELTTNQEGIFNSQNETISPSEIWANMWMDWMMGQWDWGFTLADARSSWMDQYMRDHFR